MPDFVKAAADPLIGTIIDDRYRVLRVIGRGGMGVVYEAEATRLGDRLCAVKVLLPEFTRDEIAVARFRREAQVAARVKHPNVVEIFDTGATSGGLGYIAMELLSGETLDRLLRREGPLPWPRAQRILLQICRALAAAHAQKIVHRDMKPENCFRCGAEDVEDFIKVLDFGIAKRTSTDDPGIRLTATNSIVGTCAYMSFEQVRGEAVDHRADIWAVGVILYEMLTGLLPFRGNNQGQVWTAITHYEPEPLRNVAPGASIPEAVEAIVSRALAKALPERYATIEALARAIAGVQSDAVSPEPSNRRGPPSQSVIDPLALTGGRTAAMPGGVNHQAATEVAPKAAAGSTFEVLITASSPATNPYGHAEGAPVGRGALDAKTVELQAESREPAHPGRPQGRKAIVGIVALTVAAAVFGGILLLSPPDPLVAEQSAQVERPRAEAADVNVQPPQSSEKPGPAVAGPGPTVTALAPVAADTAPPSADPPLRAVEPDPGARPAKVRRPTAPTTPKPLPESVTVEHLRASLNLKRAALERCREQGGYAGMRLQVDVTVAPTGVVSSARVHKPYNATDVGRCVVEVLGAAKLPRSTAGGELSDTVTL